MLGLCMHKLIFQVHSTCHGSNPAEASPVWVVSVQISRILISRLERWNVLKCVFLPLWVHVSLVCLQLLVYVGNLLLPAVRSSPLAFVSTLSAQILSGSQVSFPCSIDLHWSLWVEWHFPFTGTFVLDDPSSQGPLRSISFTMQYVPLQCIRRFFETILRKVTALLHFGKAQSCSFQFNSSSR